MISTESLIDHIDGFIDSLDEHVTHEDMANALAALRELVQAHAPTDDEHDALTTVILDATYQATAGECRRAASAVLAAGFRRSEVPEPQAEPADHEREAISDAFDEMHRITEGGCDTRGDDVADMALGLGFRHTAQGEPSDAQVTAEALRKWPHDPNDANVSSARAARRLSFLQGALWMRAALRAAGGVR